MTTISGQSGGTAADYAAQLDQLFLQYEGRHATADELSSLGAQLASGAKSVAAIRADLVGSGDGQAYLAPAISQVYQAWGGRAATTAELAVWTNEMTIHGATLATVRNAVLGDPLGQTYTAAQVSQAYQATFSRAPTVGELAAWQSQFLAGLASPASVATALLANAQVASIDDQVRQAYQTWGGRAPTDGELATWRDTMLHGGTVARLKADIIADPLGTNYLNGQVTQAYQQWLGRAPTAGELATWHGTFANGGQIGQLQNDLAADASVVTYQTTQLAQLFASHGWGTPTTQDAATLMAGLRAGQSFADAAAAVPHHNSLDPAVLVHIYEDFGAWLGRAPGETEAYAAAAYVQADGTGGDQLRATLLAGGEGQGYVTAQVGAAYQQLLGRAPTAGELAGWADQIVNHGGTFDGVRAAILDTAEGHAQAAAVLADIYSRLLDRAPTAGEVQDAITGLAQGRSFAGLAAGAFASAEGQVHFSDTLGALYTELMGRAPTQADSSAWFDTLYQGADYRMVRAALMLDPTSTATHLIGTLDTDSFALGANPGDVVVSAFDPAHDRLVVGAQLAGTNLLDAAHATQVTSLDGQTPNVLIRLDDHDTLLIHGVTLAQLSAADFQFG